MRLIGNVSTATTRLHTIDYNEPAAILSTRGCGVTYAFVLGLWCCVLYTQADVFQTDLMDRSVNIKNKSKNGAKIWI